MSTSLTQDLPVGDVQFYDNYVPSLPGGNWRIEVQHSLAGVDTGSLGATQEFVVSAPQFAIDPNAVVNQYPPDGSTGLYGQVLPHVILKDPLLPWERAMNGSSQTQPWLALLVLGEDELLGGADSPTRTQTANVSAFLQADAAILKPGLQQEDDVAGTDPCAFIQIPTALFTALTPRLEELRFLAHCRQSNIADKAEQGLEQNGLFSAVVGNRFPAVPDPGATGPTKSIVHLVSLEGWESYLVDAPDFGQHTSVALISLASWTFLTLPNNLEDFRGLMEAIVAQEYDGQSYQPGNLTLRLPAPQPPIDTGTPAGAEASRRLADGFVPMNYQLRTGEQTFAWYRGPFVPAPTTPLNPPEPFLTADSALIYQSAFGVFDASLAAAWEAGRAVALSDRSFAQTLFNLRRRLHQLSDVLLERLQSDAFTATQISDLSEQTTAQDELLAILNNDLLADIGAPPVPPPPLPAYTPTDPPDPKAAVENFLADPDAQQTISDLIASDLNPVAAWLGRLLLLYNVPFNLLVPDDRLLEPETLRFFYLDNNWTQCLRDGATSLGLESSRATFAHTMTHGLISRAAQDAAQVHRSTLLGVEPPAAQAAENLVSGFLLRSAVVSGWPNLAVRGAKKDGTALKILRLDHVASDLLLCLFWGTPDSVEFSEPQEGYRFGVDDDGALPLRQPVAGATPLGQQLSTGPFQVTPGFLRAGANRVLNLAPASSVGLIQSLQTKLNTPTNILSTFGPADFALQMVKSPEAIIFNAQTS